MKVESQEGTLRLTFTQNSVYTFAGVEGQWYISEKILLLKALDVVLSPDSESPLRQLVAKPDTSLGLLAIP